jgi:hypothetical protein
MIMTDEQCSYHKAQDGRSRFPAVGPGQTQTSLCGAVMRPERHPCLAPRRPNRSVIISEVRRGG